MSYVPPRVDVQLGSPVTVGITVPVPGPPGPPGPQGPPGVQEPVAYRHVQTAPAAVWTISHGLGFNPNVTAVDSAHREMWPGEVDYPSAVTVRLIFSAAVGGEAFCS